MAKFKVPVTMTVEAEDGDEALGKVVDALDLLKDYIEVGSPWDAENHEAMLLESKRLAEWIVDHDTDDDPVAKELLTLIQHGWTSSEHVITYYVMRRMTLGEWLELDDRMGAALEAVGIAEDTTGVAGPIPEVGAALDDEEVDDAEETVAEEDGGSQG